MIEKSNTNKTHLLLFPTVLIIITMEVFLLSSFAVSREPISGPHLKVPGEIGVIEVETTSDHYVFKVHDAASNQGVIKLTNSVNVVVHEAEMELNPEESIYSLKKNTLLPGNYTVEIRSELDFFSTTITH